MQCAQVVWFQRLPASFCLLGLNLRRSLPPMGTARIFEGLADRADASWATPLGRRKKSAAIGPVALWDTLHCSSGVAGSAAQFNQSVSAMPCDNPRQINAPRQGTADTLLIGWLKRCTP